MGGGARPACGVIWESRRGRRPQQVHWRPRGTSEARPGRCAPGLRCGPEEPVRLQSAHLEHFLERARRVCGSQRSKSPRRHRDLCGPYLALTSTSIGRLGQVVVFAAGNPAAPRHLLLQEPQNWAHLAEGCRRPQPALPRACSPRRPWGEGGTCTGADRKATHTQNKSKPFSSLLHPGTLRTPPAQKSWLEALLPAVPNPKTDAEPPGLLLLAARLHAERGTCLWALPPPLCGSQSCLPLPPRPTSHNLWDCLSFTLSFLLFLSFLLGLTE